MSNVDFGLIPPFVRIKSVDMPQFWPAIVQHLLPLLKQFSGNFTNSPMLQLNASIEWSNFPVRSFTDSDSNQSFDEFPKLLSCLRIMFEIFEQCSPQFTFYVNARNYRQLDSMPLIASTLELPSVQVSENVHFYFPAINRYVYYSWDSMQYQVKTISDWLHRPYVGGGTISTPRVDYIRSLTIGSTEHRDMSFSRYRIGQLFEDLKVVSFYPNFNVLNLARVKLSNVCGELGTGTL